MKKLILTLAIALTSNFSIAESNDLVRLKCESNSKLAESTMRYRQSGNGITDAMKILREHDFDEASYLVILAYKEPLWSTQENKEKAITEFGNNFYITCIEVMKKIS